MTGQADLYATFKQLEAEHRQVLDPAQLHVLRVDGRAFATYTRGLDAPYDVRFAAAMNDAAAAVAKDLGALVTYVASDEVSVVFSGRGPREPAVQFGGVVAKVLSLSAATASAAFNLAHYDRKQVLATFDARVISVDTPELVRDYLRWRQADTYRNAVAMAAQTMFSHRQLLGVKVPQARQMVEEKTGQPFHQHYPAEFLYGRVVRRNVRLQETAFTHRRTRQQQTVTAYRSFWEAETAPNFDSLTAAQILGH